MLHGAGQALAGGTLKPSDRVEAGADCAADWKALAELQTNAESCEVLLCYAGLGRR